MRLLGFDSNNRVLTADARNAHHYHAIRRVHPNGPRARIVLSTEPGKPGKIIELPWADFHKSVIKRSS